MPTIDFAYHIANTITSPYNQHATLISYATTGAGKDWACMAIGECVAQHVAEIKGGSPEDYFNIDNIAVITEDEVIRVLKTRMDKPYSIIGFSDIGLTWNAREFMNKLNKAMNDILQIFRTRNLFLYMTLPNPNLIDIVPRELSKYVLEIEQSNFDWGYVDAKIFETIGKPRIRRDPFKQYLRDLDGNPIKRHKIFRPSFALAEEYDKRRRINEALSTSERVSTIENLINFDPEEEKRITKEKKEKLDNLKVNLSFEKQKMIEERNKARLEFEKEKFEKRLLKEADRIKRDLQVIELAKQGKTWEEIQSITKAHSHAISTILKAAGLSSQRHNDT